MAGEFTSLRYDPEALEESTQRMTLECSYRLDPNVFVNCISSGRNNFQNMTRTESELKNINKPNSKSVALNRPRRLQHQSNNSVNDVLAPTYSRYTHPASDIKGMNVEDLRLDYPLHDPQCSIFENFSVDTRLQSKDNHRTVWQIPMNQTDLLPNRSLGRSVINPSCKYANF